MGKTFLLAAILLAPPARANPMRFATGPVSTAGGSNVNAEAWFSFNVTSHTITVQLINLQVNPRSVGQLISGVEFDLTDLGPGPLYGSVTSSTENTFAIDSSGAPGVERQANSWMVQKIGADSLSLCEICKLGGGRPDELIIGGPDPATGTYEAAGGSIADNGPHNPFILGSGATYSSGLMSTLTYTAPTWILSVPTITAATGIRSARVFFGTSYSPDLMSVASSISTPEPAPLVMILGGLALIAAARVSRRWHKR